MKSTLLFNPDGNDQKESRLMWFGDPTNLMQLNEARYTWAVKLWKQMREQFWIAEKVDLTTDIQDYQNLTSEEQKAFEGILSYLNFLDSIQTVNIPHLVLPITAIEIRMCLSEQTSQETLHAQSYQYILDSLFADDTNKKNEIINFWRTDKILLDRCAYIAKLYQQYVDNPSDENYFIALVADYILEGLYFYVGFQFFYSLCSRQLMPGTSDIFVYINRDELSHVRLYQEMIKVAIASQKFPYSEEQIYEMVNTAVSHEVKWAGHIIGDSILGMTVNANEQYVKYLADIRLKAIGLNALYGVELNPYKHLESIAAIDKNVNTKQNFFENTVTSYQMSTALDGWDDL